MTGITMLYGTDATADTVGVKSFEEQPVAVDAAGELGRKIAEALKAMENHWPTAGERSRCVAI